jgi:hypothetical protein
VDDEKRIKRIELGQAWPTATVIRGIRSAEFRFKEGADTDHPMEAMVKKTG